MKSTARFTRPPAPRQDTRLWAGAVLACLGLAGRPGFALEAAAGPGVSLAGGWVLGGAAVLLMFSVGLFARRRRAFAQLRELNDKLRLQMREQGRVTERLIASEQRFHHFFENAATPMLIHDQWGRLQEVNHSACTNLGYTRAELLEFLISDIVQDPPQASPQALWRRLEPEQPQHYEWTFRRKDGSLFPVEVDLGKLDADLKDPLFLSIARDVSEKKRAEEAMRESEARYRVLFDTVTVGIALHELVYTADGEITDYRILDVNPAYEKILDIPKEQARGRLASQVYPGQGAPFLEIVGKVAETGRACQFESDALPGRSLSLSVSCAGHRRFAIVFEDISRRRRDEAALHQAATVLENLKEGVVITDLKLRIQAVNPAFCAITGYTAQEALGRTPSLLKSGRHDDAFYRDMYAHLTEHGHWEGEIWNRRKNGEVYPEWLSISVRRDVTDAPSGYVAIFSDITRRKEAEKMLWYRANYDALTELPNRTLFNDRLNRVLAAAQRAGNPVTLMIVDLDRFKWINESLGHAQADQLLKETARRLSLCLPEADTVARFGGDEFSIVVPNLGQLQEVETLARKITGCLSGGVRIGEHEAFLTCSIGIAVFPGDGEDVEALERKANAAMHRAREGGQNTFRFYTPEMDNLAHERMRLERDLRYALERGEFILHYQPVVALESRSLLGAEVLIRWRHPLRGLVRPDRFIPLAEETGLIIPISEWVLDETCRQGKAWLDQGLPPVELAVNISRRLFHETDLHAMISSALRRSGFPGHLLALEITETLVMEEAETAVEKMESLRALGIHYLLDDFGTGYSSLSYLKRLPVDILKIDRSFVRDVLKDPDSASLVQAIVAMAHSLRMRVVAEGVEKPEQMDFLRAAGCEYAQGYYFSFPLMAEDFAAFLKNAAPPSALRHA